MKFDGENAEAVLSAHFRYLESGGEYEEGRADFSGCNLSSSCFFHMDLSGAIFRDADLSFACLAFGNFTRADFTGALFHETDVFRADFRGAIGLPYIPLLIPSTGAFVGWKRAVRRITGAYKREYDDSVIVKLLIPEDALRSTNQAYECRASKAVVLEVQDVEGNVLNGVPAFSIYNPNVIYIPGKEIIAERWGEERWNLHEPGIYFYPDREQAVRYLTRGKDKDGNIVKFDTPAILRELNDRNNWEYAKGKIR